MNIKKVVIAIVAICVILAMAVAGAILVKKGIIKIGKIENREPGVEMAESEIEAKEEEPKEVKKVDIVDVDSKIRPYAISVNNTPVAVKVQTGLNKAYIVYEIPTEGNTSRLLAFYQNNGEDFNVGTIRSARHNFIDYALESNAIFVHFGWSHYAQDQEKAGVINYINGLFDKPFWRENPEKLASEHTAYTSIAKIKECIESKGFATESSDTILLNYNVEDVDISEKTDAKVANKITIPYGAAPNITTFVYDEENKMYNRMENNIQCIDYNTKEKVSTKNIIVQKVNYSICSDNYYWDLKTIGSGEGYFITNGHAVPITWKKADRKSKTKYYYMDGTEIEVSDGRTYIEIQTTKQQLTIE